MGRISLRGIIINVVVLLAAFLLATLIRDNVVGGAIIVGDSMSPTLHQNDIIALNKTSIGIRKIKRYDVITIGKGCVEDTIVKRVVGLEGDIINIVGGKVLLNGSIMYEPYLPEGTQTYPYGKDEWKVSGGKIFVLGDNRVNSLDSRYLGLIDEECITGVMITTKNNRK